MTVDYRSSLQSIFSAIALPSNESDVENKVIALILQLLGYDSTDWESQAIVGKSKLDFLLLPPSSVMPYAPYLVIEAKAPNKNLSHTALSAIMQYSFLSFSLSYHSFQL